MKKLLIILFFSFFLSCTIKRNLSGLYGKCGEHYFACTQLLLKDDNTFEYFVFHDLGGSNIRKGTWEKLGKNVLILNSDEQPKNPKTYVSGKFEPRNSELQIIVQDKNGVLPGVTVNINNQHYKETDLNGIVRFPILKIKSITCTFLDINETITLENPNYNAINIMLKDSDPSLIIDEKIYVSANGLKIPSGGLVLRKFYLEKTDMKEKQW